MKLINLSDIKKQPAKHNPKIKRQIIFAKKDVPNLEILGQVILKSGQIIREHIHEHSHEVMLMTGGSGIVKVNGKVEKIKDGDCLVVGPKEAHELLNTSSEEIVITYIEIKNSDNKNKKK